MTNVYIISGVILILLMFFPLFRILTGPTPMDRLVGVNVIGTKTTILIVLVGTLVGRVDMFVDIALAYALLNFIASLAASRFFQRHTHKNLVSGEEV